MCALVAIVLMGGARPVHQPTSPAPAPPAEFLGSVDLTPAATQVELIHDAIPAAIQSPAINVTSPLVKSSLGRVVIMEVTAYCPCKKCCGPDAAGITASGKRVSQNAGQFVAADSAIPFHTRVIIPGYASGKPVPVLDRGGAIKGNKIDVFFPTHAQALQWGRREVAVTILP